MEHRYSSPWDHRNDPWSEIKHENYIFDLKNKKKNIDLEYWIFLKHVFFLPLTNAQLGTLPLQQFHRYPDLATYLHFLRP